MDTESCPEGEVVVQTIHAIIWLDHLEARVVKFSDDESEVAEVESKSPIRQIHRKSGMRGDGHLPDDHDFFDEVVAQVDGVREVLVAGPGNAKTAFHKYVITKHPDLAGRIVGVEPLDHPSDGELAAYARTYFKKVDQRGAS